jgi:hypothetical protein
MTEGVQSNYPSSAKARNRERGAMTRPSATPANDYNKLIKTDESGKIDVSLLEENEYWEVLITSTPTAGYEYASVEAAVIAGKKRMLIDVDTILEDPTFSIDVEGLHIKGIGSRDACVWVPDGIVDFGKGHAHFENITIGATTVASQLLWDAATYTNAIANVKFTNCKIIAAGSVGNPTGLDVGGSNETAAIAAVGTLADPISNFVFRDCEFYGDTAFTGPAAWLFFGGAIYDIELERNQTIEGNTLTRYLIQIGEDGLDTFNDATLNKSGIKIHRNTCDPTYGASIVIIGEYVGDIKIFKNVGLQEILARGFLEATQIRIDKNEFLGDADGVKIQVYDTAITQEVRVLENYVLMSGGYSIKLFSINCGGLGGSTYNKTNTDADSIHIIGNSLGNESSPGIGQIFEFNVELPSAVGLTWSSVKNVNIIRNSGATKDSASIWNYSSDTSGAGQDHLQLTENINIRNNNFWIGDTTLAGMMTIAYIVNAACTTSQLFTTLNIEGNTLECVGTDGVINFLETDLQGCDNGVDAVDVNISNNVVNGQATNVVFNAANLHQAYTATKTSGLNHNWKINKNKINGPDATASVAALSTLYSCNNAVEIKGLDVCENTFSSLQHIARFVFLDGTDQTSGDFELTDIKVFKNECRRDAIDTGGTECTMFLIESEQALKAKNVVVDKNICDYNVSVANAVGVFRAFSFNDGGTADLLSEFENVEITNNKFITDGDQSAAYMLFFDIQNQVGKAYFVNCNVDGNSFTGQAAITRAVRIECKGYAAATANFSKYNGFNINDNIIACKDNYTTGVSASDIGIVETANISGDDTADDLDYCLSMSIQRNKITGYLETGSGTYIYYGTFANTQPMMHRTIHIKDNITNLVFSAGATGTSYGYFIEAVPDSSALDQLIYEGNTINAINAGYHVYIDISAPNTLGIYKMLIHNNIGVNLTNLAWIGGGGDIFDAGVFLDGCYFGGNKCNTVTNVIAIGVGDFSVKNDGNNDVS